MDRGLSGRTLEWSRVAFVLIWLRRQSLQSIYTVCWSLQNECTVTLHNSKVSMSASVQLSFSFGRELILFFDCDLLD